MSEPEVAPPPRVSRFEANLLNILRFFLRRLTVERAGRLIVQECPPPRCLTRAAVTLAQDMLAKGCTSLLAHAGGWRRERHLRGNQVVTGRLWERTDPEDLGLTFSKETLDFLIWVTAEDLDAKKARWWSPADRALTLGDRVLLYYAYGALRETSVGPAAANKVVFATHALCRLAYPEDFGKLTANFESSFVPWTGGVGACILEALQGELAERWLMVERRKVQIVTWQTMQALGRSQGQALDAFFTALEASGRRDLARFLLVTLSRLLTEDATAQRWLDGVQDRGPTMAERVQTGRAALVLLRQLQRLRRWAQAARTVAFFEESYTASQLWKTDWEHGQGDVLHARAEAILREVEPL